MRVYVYVFMCVCVLFDLRKCRCVARDDDAGVVLYKVHLVSDRVSGQSDDAQVQRKHSRLASDRTTTPHSPKFKVAVISL